VLSVRRLWLSPEDPTRARFYAMLKAMTVFVTLGSALLLPGTVVLPAFSYWVAVIYWATIAFPITLWGMYFGCRWFFFIVNRTK
jgi:hypothetical protein